MTYARTLLKDFILQNPIYSNGTVTFYTIDNNGLKTNIKANLYNQISGGLPIANPQTLDSQGKLKQPTYHDTPLIATVTGLGNIDDHDTGVIGILPILSGTGSPENNVIGTIGTLYLRTDGGAGTTLYVKESGTGNTGWVGK